MKPETISKFEEVLKEGFKLAELPTRSVGIAKKIVPIIIDEVFSASEPELMLAVGISAFLLAQLERAPEPSDADLEKTLEFLRRLPYDLKGKFRVGLQKTISLLPRKPGSGLRKELLPHQQRELILLVQKKEKEGMKKGEAYEYAARKFGLGKRTVQRYFANRRTIFAKPQSSS